LKNYKTVKAKKRIDWEDILTHSYKHAEIMDLEERLLSCELALKEYSDVISYGDGYPELGRIIEDLNETEQPDDDSSELDLHKFIKNFKPRLSHTEELFYYQLLKRLMNVAEELDSSKDILFYIGTLRNKKIQEREIIEHCFNCCQYLIMLRLHRLEEKEKHQYMFYMHYVPARSYEALGYWTRKLEEMKVAKKGRDTQKENEAMKEKAVKQAYIKLVNEHVTPAQKKSFSTQSKNKMAEHVKEIAIEALKNRKTSKGELVLKRKLDEKGTTQYSGLSIDTVINILDKQVFKFYPWKKKSLTK